MLDDENTSISAIDNTEENYYNQTPDYNVFTQETPISTISTEQEPPADSYFVEPVNPTDSDSYSNSDSNLDSDSEPEPDSDSESATSSEYISQPKSIETIEDSQDSQDSQEAPMEIQRKTYKDLTDEEKRRIIARSDEVGIHQTAVEFGTNWQLVVAVRMRGGAANTMSLADYETKYKKRPDKDSTHKVIRRNRRSKPIIQKQTQVRASIVSTFSTDRTSEKTRQRELLKENAMLQKEIATLEWQIDRLRSAVRDLVE